MTESGLVSDASIANFLEFAVAKLKAFIHARKLEGSVSKEALFSPQGVKINKTQFKTQTAESIENNCNNERPCYAWSVGMEATVVRSYAQGSSGTYSLYWPHTA